MAKVQLIHGVTIKQARNQLRRNNATFRLTIRNGAIYTFKKFICQQPNTQSQIDARNRLKEASRLAAIDMQNPIQNLYWQQQKNILGYKTAIGCAKAHYIALLKSKTDTQPHFNPQTAFAPTHLFNVEMPFKRYFNTKTTKHTQKRTKSSLLTHIYMYKKALIQLTAAFLLTFGYQHTSAQPDTAKFYIFFDKMPDAGIYLPAPPDTASLSYVDDVIQWQWGKTLRNTPRGALANYDAKWGHEVVAEIFSGIFGFNINPEQTPAIWKLIVKSSYTGHFSTTKAKRKYMRTRPFAQFGEHTWSEYDDDKSLRHNGSYPSGHTSLFWSAALTLAEMAPELQDTILRRAYQYSESRVIVGAHYQSDIEAGRLAASAGYAIMHTNPNFQADIKAARNEFCNLKGIKTEVNASMPQGQKILDAPVDTISRRFYGDVATYWQSKAERNTERGRQAIADADCSDTAFMRIFSPLIGISLSNSETPAIAQLISVSKSAFVDNANSLKNIYFRKRPYVQLAEPSLIPDTEDAYRHSSSYPSSNAQIGWGIALLLAEIAPEHQNEILTRGFEYGRSRIIAGYNYVTDVQAGRFMATTVVARLHANPDFQKLLDKAKKEYNQKMKQ